MRTDSLRLSEEAVAAAREFIVGRYGASYAQTHRYKAKAGAQDGHEAIRPSNVNLTPEQVTKDVYKRQALSCGRASSTRSSGCWPSGASRWCTWSGSGWPIWGWTRRSHGEIGDF